MTPNNVTSLSLWSACSNNRHPSNPFLPNSQPPLGSIPPYPAVVCSGNEREGVKVCEVDGGVMCERQHAVALLVGLAVDGAVTHAALPVAGGGGGGGGREGGRARRVRRCGVQCNIANVNEETCTNI
jgi:hypothetical protein